MYIQVSCIRNGGGLPMVNREELVYAPLSGEVKQLEDVPDPTFAEKMMGDGIAIEPSDGKVTAPLNGEIVQIFPTKHAVGLKGENGVEVLIHIGLDTVNLNGEGFTAYVSQGDYVNIGDPLITFDLDFIRKKVPSVITLIIITNDSDFEGMEMTSDSMVTGGESVLLTIQPKEEETDGKENPAPESAKAQGQYSQEVKDIVAALGGEDNINVATHCVTRLRFALSDDDKVNKEELENLDIVKGSFLSSGQFQVVIGQGTVDKVYAAMINQTSVSEASKDDVKAANGKKQNPLQQAIKVLADVFIPILPAIVTAGLLMGINNILVNPVFWDESVVERYPQWAGLADMINIIANTAFTFLPALIGWSAVKRFGGNELLGVVLGLIMVHPALLNAWEYGDAIKEGTVPVWNLFGYEVDKIGYQGQVLPVLVASWVLAKIEIFMRKRVLDSLQLLVVAPVALLVTGFLTFIIIGPITFAIGNTITDGIIAVFDSFPIIGGLLYGAIYAPLVITGMHHTFLAVDLQLIGSTGSTFLWPILALSNIAQGSAAFAMMVAVKEEKLKGLAGTSGISAYLGITEPAMFGVNLRFKFPFIAAVIGSSIAGGWVTWQSVKATSIGIGGIPAPLSIIPEGWFAFAIGMVIVIVIPFLITLLIGLRKLDK